MFRGSKKGMKVILFLSLFNRYMAIILTSTFINNTVCVVTDVLFICFQFFNVTLSLNY